MVKELYRMLLKNREIRDQGNGNLVDGRRSKR